MIKTASAPIHLAISKIYLERNPQLDYTSVLAGTLYPDTFKDKDTSHFTDLNRGKDNISHLRGKVNLFNFLNSKPELLGDFDLGWFIHLVTDYLFFDECFTKEYLLTHSYEEFRRDLYFAYDCLNQYITKKYGITKEDYTTYLSEFYEGTFYQECLFSKEMIDNFILRVSSIDFNRYVRKIRKYKRNVKP